MSKDFIEDISLNPEDHSGYEWFSEEDVISRKTELAPTEHVTHTHEDDPEYPAILKGFKLLRGVQTNFG